MGRSGWMKLCAVVLWIFAAFALLDWILVPKPEGFAPGVVDNVAYLAAILGFGLGVICLLLAEIVEHVAKTDGTP